MSTKKDRMYQQIENHGKNLDAIFPNAEKHGLALSKALRQLEVKATRYTLALCNGGSDYEQAEPELEKIEAKLRKMLGVDDEFPVFINRDPRGYALKIRDEYVREHSLAIYRDWGGYGILSPEFNGE